MPSLNAVNPSNLSLCAVVFSLFACASPAPPSPKPTPDTASPGIATPGGEAARGEPSPASPKTPPTPAAATPPSDQTAPPPASDPPLPAHTVVLHVGDSFAESLGSPLGRRLQANGLRQVLESKTPSYIPTWAGSGELRRFLDKYKPDLVLVTLGGNEFDIPAPADRVEPVKRLVAQLAGHPCVWITPPRWKADSGVLAVIRDNSSPCRYLDSDTIVHDLPLARDKVHPTEAGRELWAEAVLGWLKAERRPDANRPWALKP